MEVRQAMKQTIRQALSVLGVRPSRVLPDRIGTMSIYYCLLVKLQSLFGIIKEEINAKKNWRKKNFTQESNKLLHLFNNEGTILYSLD